MKLNQQQAQAVMYATISEQLKHADYLRTIELMDMYTKYITGHNLESELIQFNPREELHMFEQRIRLSNLTAPALLSSVMNPFYQVTRTDRIVKKIIPSVKGNTELISQIQEKINLFYGSDNEEGGLDFWLKERFVELSFTDPNTFIVMEFDEFNRLIEHPTAYPFEVSADMAVNFEIENNNVDWLIAREEIQFYIEPTLKKTSKGFKYTIYCGAFNYVYRQVSGELAVQTKDVAENETVLTIKQGSTDLFFAVSVYNVKMEDWQMFRIGYVRDLQTKGRTFVTPYHSAMCHLKSSIKDVSEFNVAKSAHVFPQKLQYVTSCDGEPNDSCNKGRNTEGLICGACKGKGVQVHTSSMDVITMPLPEDKSEEIIPLRDMIAYFTPPIELLDFMDKQVDKYEVKIHQAVFNSTVLVQKTVVATATEKEQDMQNVYNTLSKFATKASACYLNVAYAIALLMGVSDKVSFVYRFPADFKMKSRQTLYNELKTINESGAPSFVKQSVEDDLAEQIYQDDPEGLLRHKVKSNLAPFKGKSEAQIAALLSSPLVLDETKILWNYFEEVFKTAEQLNKKFYFLKYQQQLDVITGILETIKVQLTPASPKLNIEEEIQE